MPDGDRIGECLFRGHKLDEAITLSESICDHWAEGVSLLPLPERHELRTLAKALGVLFASGCNILKFYRLRALLGKQLGDACEILREMQSLIHAEMENTRTMIALSAADLRLGYHSEAEGFKFFPEKLEDRLESLRALLADEFPVVERRLTEGKPPLGYYYAEGQTARNLGPDMIEIDQKRSFSLDQTEDGVVATVLCPKGDDVTLDYEFDLFMPECGIVISESPMPLHGESLECHPPGIGLAMGATSHQSVFGEKLPQELSKHHLQRQELADSMIRYRVFTTVPQEKWNRRTAIKLRITIGGISWIPSPDPVITLGKANVIPDEYGFFIP
jgi:hypothetical protein